jgi:hypothetical protein
MKLPQLILRDLFWLVLVCALAVGWWVEHSSLRAQLKGVQSEAAKWKSDAERCGKYLLSLPPTGFNYDPSLIPTLPELPMAAP